MLKEMGCNAIRTSHNPPAPELLDLCDRMGIVVMDEAFDTWSRAKTPNDYALLFADWHEKDLRALVRRDRNHPCVILWSIGNEIAEQGMGEQGGRHRPGTRHASCTRRTRRGPRPPAATTPRAGSRFRGCDRHHRRELSGLTAVAGISRTALSSCSTRPARSIFVYGSETASTISSRGVYTFPVAAQPGAITRRTARIGRDRMSPSHQMSSYDLYYPRWATSPDTEFAAQDRFPFVGGEFVWTGWDYLGEPTPWGDANDPSRSSYFGIIDLAGFKKDRFYLYQARWRPDLPMAHILPHWTLARPRRPGDARARVHLRR